MERSADCAQGQMSHSGPVENLGPWPARKRCDQIGPLPYNWHVLTEEDKQWISERLEKVETTFLAGFHKGTSPVELRQRSHAAALRELDAEVESLSDRLKNLEGR
jgi:hypothetical protein